MYELVAMFQFSVPCSRRFLGWRSDPSVALNVALEISPRYLSVVDYNLRPSVLPAPQASARCIIRLAHEFRAIPYVGSLPQQFRWLCFLTCNIRRNISATSAASSRSMCVNCSTFHIYAPYFSSIT